MRALLDVNVLIALLDVDHASHGTALRWFSENADSGWSSCPLTQNGCIRIMSSPGYPGFQPSMAVAGRLRVWTEHKAHGFWPDEVSLLDDSLVDMSRIHGPRQLTDAYLLALAVRNDGRLVTFDRTMPTSAVKGAKPRHVVAL